MKIDVFNHLFPKRYFEKMTEVCDNRQKLKRYLDIPMLIDLDVRFAAMDLFGAAVRVPLRGHGRIRPADLDPPDASASSQARASAICRASFFLTSFSGRISRSSATTLSRRSGTSCLPHAHQELLDGGRFMAQAPSGNL